MWGLVLLFVFVLVLSLVLRRAHQREISRKREEVIIAIIPIVVEQGMPVAVLPDNTHAQITFEGKGLQAGLQTDRFSGVQIIEMQDGAPIKAPVQLSRRGRPKISALNLGPDVKAITLDFGTRQMMLHGSESSNPAQFRYERHDTGSQITLTPLGNKMWNRAGSVSMDLNRAESEGMKGMVRCGGARLHVFHSVPGYDTAVGRRDILQGKHRMTFNLKSKTAFVQ